MNIYFGIGFLFGAIISGVITFRWIKNTAPTVWELAKKEKENTDLGYIGSSSAHSTKWAYVGLYIVCFLVLTCVFGLIIFFIVFSLHTGNFLTED